MSWILIIFWFGSHAGQIETIQDLTKDQCERLKSRITSPTAGKFEVQCVNKYQ